MLYNSGMKTTITLKCRRCGSTNIVRNGKKACKLQNYLCKDCGRQFISEQDRTYKGTSAGIDEMIVRALVRGCGIRDVAIILLVSIGKVLSVLVNSHYDLKPMKPHYAQLETDELWTFVGSKSHRQWLIYAYERESAEIVAYVWGDRSSKTANRLREKLKDLGVTYDRIATDDWDSFIKAFANDAHVVGKEYTVGIEGNNCRLRHRMRRIFRKTCNFSKKLVNHFKAFEMTVHYINFGYA
jgi:IS1 family transposase/transposase-like protein